MPPGSSRVRVLITGAAGFVGANLALHLAYSDAGHDVHIMVRSHDPEKAPRMRFVLPVVDDVHIGDVASTEDVRLIMRAVNPDWVFHCAMYGGNAGQDDPPEMFQTNVRGAIRMAEESARAGVRSFINCGSSSEYGLDNDHHPEHIVARPNTMYGWSKLAGTKYVGYMREMNTGTHFTTMRLFSAFGPMERDTRFIPQVLRGARIGALPPLSNAATARDFIYVEDVCLALVMAAELRLPEPIYNLGTRRQYTLGEAVEEIRTLLDCEDVPKWGTAPPRQLDPPAWVADNALLARDAPDFKPRSFRDGVLDFSGWMDERGERVGC